MEKECEMCGGHETVRPLYHVNYMICPACADKRRPGYSEIYSGILHANQNISLTDAAVMAKEEWHRRNA